MKREPRLQFSDADLAEPKLEKPIKRVKKAEAKADKAQAKIPKKTVVKKERGFDPATGKVKTQLRFEEVDKKKPPSKLTHAVQDAPANFVLSQVHREVRQSEDDNVGVEAAHKVEQAVESGGRLVQSAHRAHQLKPYRAAIRAEKKLERANLDALQKKAEIDSPTSNPKTLDASVSPPRSAVPRSRLSTPASSSMPPATPPPPTSAASSTKSSSASTRSTASCSTPKSASSAKHKPRNI